MSGIPQRKTFMTSPAFFHFPVAPERPGGVRAKPAPSPIAAMMRERGLAADAEKTHSGVAGKGVAGQVVRLLLVGAAAELRQAMRQRLADPSWSVREAHSGSDALEQLMQEPSEILLLAPSLPDLDVVEFQEIVRGQFPGVQVISLAASTAPTPIGAPPLSGMAHGLSELLQLDRPIRPVPPAMRSEPHPDQSVRAAAIRSWQGIIGDSAVMQRVFHAAKLVARRDTTVLIQGESGTGKDLIAQAIHNTSARNKQPFVVINCAAIPEPLLEAELFGHTKGAFTGAAQSRIGRIHAAHGGTLFLDEIGDMPYPLQSKILRFLEQGEVQRIGGTDTLKVDCRVIAATNAELKQQVNAKQFREDLYYRLAIFPIRLPPLRERMDDVDSLAAGFLERFCPGVRLHPEARQMLLEHAWPGNVRELRNVIERASLFAESRQEILADDIVL